MQVYPIVREMHQHVEDEDVKEGCDRLVQVLMRDEEDEAGGEPRIQEVQEEGEDDQMIEV